MVEEFIFFLSAAAADVKLNCVRPTYVCVRVLQFTISIAIIDKIVSVFAMKILTRSRVRFDSL